MPQTHQPDHFLIDREKKNQEKPKVTTYTYICINRLYIKKVSKPIPLLSSNVSRKNQLVDCGIDACIQKQILHNSSAKNNYLQGICSTANRSRIPWISESTCVLLVGWDRQQKLG